MWRLPRTLQLTTADGSRARKLRERLLRHSRYSTTEGWRWHRKARKNSWKQPRASESKKQLYSKVHSMADRSELSVREIGERTKEQRELATRQQRRDRERAHALPQFRKLVAYQ